MLEGGWYDRQFWVYHARNCLKFGDFAWKVHKMNNSVNLKCYSYFSLVDISCPNMLLHEVVYKNDLLGRFANGNRHCELFPRYQMRGRWR